MTLSRSPVGATFLTLFVLPAVYAFVSRNEEPAPRSGGGREPAADVGLRHERQARLIEGVFVRQPGVLHASVAFGSRRIDVALETADVALMADDLRALPFAVGLSRAPRSVIRQNREHRRGTA